MAEDTGIHNIGSVDEFKTYIQSNEVVILDAFATWCGPCKMIAPVLVQLSKQFPTAKFAKFDVDEVGELAKELGISAMPTIVAFKNGEKVDSVRGANPPAITAMVQKSVEA